MTAQQKRDRDRRWREEHPHYGAQYMRAYREQHPEYREREKRRERETPHRRPATPDGCFSCGHRASLVIERMVIQPTGELTLAQVLYCGRC